MTCPVQRFFATLVTQFDTQPWHRELFGLTDDLPHQFKALHNTDITDFRETARGYLGYVSGLLDYMGNFSIILLPRQRETELDALVRDQFFSVWTADDSLRSSVQELKDILELSCFWFDIKFSAWVCTQWLNEGLDLSAEIVQVLGENPLEELEKQACFANQYGAPLLFVRAQEIRERLMAQSSDKWGAFICTLDLDDKHDISCALALRLLKGKKRDAREVLLGRIRVANVTYRRSSQVLLMANGNIFRPVVSTGA